MSKYTTEVRFICEQAAGYSESVGFDKVEEVLNNSWYNVIGTDWPCWAVIAPGGGAITYHAELAKKILRHYYTREIAFETAGLWKLKLITKLKEIMPYYNELYKSTLLEFDPFQDADYVREHTGKDSGTGKDVNTGEITNHNEYSNNGTTWDVYSDTPQGALVNVDENTYLTDARKVTNNNSGENSGNRTTDMSYEREYANQDEFLEHIKGKFPGRTYASMLKELRETFLNIDMMIIDDLSGLFMRLW